MTTTATTAPVFSAYAYGSTVAETDTHRIYASLFSWAIVETCNLTGPTHREVASGKAPMNAHANLAKMQAQALAAYAAL